VALGIVSVLLAFLAAMVFATRLFQNATQILAVLTALFGVIGTLVGTYFGVKAGSDAAEGAQSLARAVSPNEPTILSVEPRHGSTNVDPNTAVTATFSEDMDPATITELTFILAERDTGDPVPNAQVIYEPLTKRATLTPPAGALTANTAYRATITTDVRDQSGNALSAAFTWEFTVAP
jgi:Bacterial Ig-like domain